MAKAQKTTQDAPTAARRVDENGFELDEWGLPLVGPARLLVLDGRTDPQIDPAGWDTLPPDQDKQTPTPPDAGGEQQQEG